MKMKQWLGLFLLLGGVFGCEDAGKVSAERARPHVEFLSRAAKQDVEEVRTGLPQGAELLSELFRAAHPEQPGAEDANRALLLAREKTQDLRVAKSTFFALVALDGRVIRNDREQDLMVGKDLFLAFPELKKVAEQGYLETRGSLPEAAGVRGKEDGQWVAATWVRDEQQVRGLYVTGWSWSSYAYRLETGIRSHVLSETPEGGKVPLLYVYVIVDDAIYGAPVAPVVNGTAILEKKPLEHTPAGEIWSAPLEITGRKFGVAVQRVPELGENVAIAVLRSET